MRSTDLDKLFGLLDNLHFDSRLVRRGWRVVTGRLHGTNEPIAPSQRNAVRYALHDRIWAITIYDGRTIVVDRRLLKKPSELRLVILHEMAHANLEPAKPGKRLKNAHGAKFIRELHRLLNRGETCLEREIAYYVRKD
jgi:hypothetical protein